MGLGVTEGLLYQQRFSSSSHLLVNQRFHCSAMTAPLRMVLTRSSIILAMSLLMLQRMGVSGFLTRPSSVGQTQAARIYHWCVSSWTPETKISRKALIGRRSVFARGLIMRSLSSSSSSSKSTGSSDELVARQRELSQQIPKQGDDESRQAFLNRQREVFDNFADYFASDEAVPPVVASRLKELARRLVQHHVRSASDSSPLFRVLDIACGTGVLHPFLLQEATADLECRPISITGVDLSPNMIAKAQQNARALLDSYQERARNQSSRDSDGENKDSDSPARHSIDLCVGDIQQYLADAHHRVSQPFHAVIMNACFGNFFEPRQVLESVSGDSLILGGVVAVTHPLGAAFVAQLQEASPETVPHQLPVTKEDWNAMILGLPLEIAEFVHDTPVELVPSTALLDDSRSEESGGLYYCFLRKVRHRALDRIIRLRGTIDYGFGRGGKKLGFPTANLKSSLFQNALNDLDAGVYFGWALVEGGPDESGSHNASLMPKRNIPYKAVVNVGYSPTFVGQTNPEKIVEAHLIFDEDEVQSADNFYGEMLRLQLDAFLRPEKKFQSFPELVAQITADVKYSKEALDSEMYQLMKRDSFLKFDQSGTKSIWIGSDGGDHLASWEYQDTKHALDLVRVHRLN